MTHDYNAYARGCRCRDCRAAKAAYMRRKRWLAREAKAASWPVRHIAPGITHGTSSGYRDSGCQCTDCVVATQQYRAAEHQRAKARRG